MSQLGKITGYNLLKGPSTFDLALGDGCADCCCNCLDASEPYSDASIWACVPSDYAAYTTKTTGIFNISGSVSALPATVVCGSPSLPSPTGTWAFSLSSGGVSAAYRNHVVSCETATTYYVIEACIVFSLAGFQCTTGGVIGAFSYVTRGRIVNKPLAPLLTSGWELFGTGCAIGGGEGSIGRIEFTMPDDSATVWRYALGGSCQEACNETRCFPKCFSSNAPIRSTSHSNNPFNAGMDYSGLTATLSFT